IARHLQLAADVAAQLADRVALIVQLSQWGQPGVEQPLHERDMHLLLGAEIVEQVGLRHAGRFGDLVDGRAAEPMLRKHVERGFEYGLALLDLYARPPLWGCRLQPLLHSIWPNPLDQFYARLWSA